MGNIILGTQSEYLRRCGLAVHGVSEGAICWFYMLVISLLRQPPITTCFCVSFLTQLQLHNGSNNHYDGSHCRPLTTSSPVDTPLVADRCVTAGHSTPIDRLMSPILPQLKLYFINCPDVEIKDSSCAQRLFTPPYRTFHLSLPSCTQKLYRLITTSTVQMQFHNAI
eukprot:scaffold248421_cov67-Cyclotella_meneghiniana.AAC.1